MNNDIFTKQISSLVDGINNQIVKTSLVMSNDGLFAAIGLVVEDNKLRMCLGKVLVYKLTVDGWKNIQTIEPRNVDVDNHFGFSLAISSDGKRIAIGDNKIYDDSKGYVYIYDYDFIDEEESRCEYLLTKIIWNYKSDTVIGSNISMSGIGGYVYDGLDTIHVLDDTDINGVTVDVCYPINNIPEQVSMFKINTGITNVEKIYSNIVIATDVYNFLLYGMYIKDNKWHYFTQIHHLNLNGDTELISSKIIDTIDGYPIMDICAGTISDNGDNVAVTYRLLVNNEEVYITHIYNNVLKAKPKTKFLNKSECFIFKTDFKPISISFNKTNDKIIIGKYIDVLSNALNLNITVSSLATLKKSELEFKFVEINDNAISDLEMSLLNMYRVSDITSEEKPSKYLYLLERHDDVHYDEYKSAVVCALSEEHARLMHPVGKDLEHSTGLFPDWRKSEWVKHPDYVKVTLLGRAEDNIKIGPIDTNFMGS